MTGEDITALLKKHPVGSVCALLCIACGVIWYFRGDAVELARSELEARSAEDQKIATDVRNAHELPQHLESMQAAAKQLDDRLVRVTQLASNLQFFYRLESETGVKLLDVRQNPLPTVKGAAKSLYLAVPFTVSVQGSYKQVMDFIGRLEKGQRVSHFSSVTFTKGSALDSSSLNANINLELLGKP